MSRCGFKVSLLSDGGLPGSARCLTNLLDLPVVFIYQFISESAPRNETRLPAILSRSVEEWPRRSAEKSQPKTFRKDPILMEARLRVAQLGWNNNPGGNVGLKVRSEDEG